MGYARKDVEKTKNGIGSRINSPAVGIYLDGIPVLSKAAFNLHH